MILRRFLFNYSLIPFILTICQIINGTLLNTCDVEGGNEFDDAELGITISSIMTSKTIREIGIYWNNSNYQYGDRLMLFERDPCMFNSIKLFAYTPEISHGFLKTGKLAEFTNTSELTFQTQCLKYYLTWVRGTVIKKKICHSTYPNWMNDRKQTLGHLKMRDIFIPGTHDSVAYAKIANAKNDNMLQKYTITQDEDVLAQLIYGIRYLDIRVGRYPHDKHLYWGNHAFVKLVPLQIVINDVKFFLQNTNEIVIFDIQEFPKGFDTIEDHYKFVDYLEKEFADYLLRRPRKGWNTSLNEIWASGKRLIISYDKISIINTRNSVWSNVHQQWGNVRTIEKLYKYLYQIETDDAQQKITNPHIRFSNPRAAMAELTPRFLDVISNWLGGLRKMADKIDINITEWYNTEWQDTANIVAVDFFKTTGIINTAIKWNDVRAARHSHNP